MRWWKCLLGPEAVLQLEREAVGPSASEVKGAMINTGPRTIQFGGIFELKRRGGVGWRHVAGTYPQSLALRRLAPGGRMRVAFAFPKQLSPGRYRIRKPISTEAGRKSTVEALFVVK